MAVRAAGRPAASERRAAAALLVVLVAAVYFPVARFGFLGLDDPRFVTANAHVQAGLGAAAARWAFTTNDLGFYAPLTALSHLLDVTLFGLNPAGHHVTNVLLHAGSSVLLLLALVAMTGSVWRSFLVAALFAIHPLHVEPVAWIAERKEVLCGFFWMTALNAYVWYVRAPSPRRYAVVFAAYAAALLSKPMAVTLPFVLLLLDLWPLGRWPAGAAGTGRAASLRSLVLEKLPLLLPLPLVAWSTIGAQAEMGALGASSAFPFGERVVNALTAYGAYLVKAVAPVRLAALYPFEHGATPAWKPALGIGLLVAGTALSAVTFARRRYVATGWLWYVGTLVPVIGLVHVGSQSMADRYTYVPLVGIFLAVVWGVADRVAASPPPARRTAAVAAGIALAALASLAHAQVLTWKDDVSLYGQMLRVSPRAVLGYFNLGNHYLLEEGDTEKARVVYEQALSIDPRYGDIQLALGTALIRQGKIDEAILHLAEATRLKPDLAPAHASLAAALAQRRRFAEAAAAYERYAALRPDDPAGSAGLGLVRGEMGDWAGAVAALTRAQQLRPDDGGSWAMLGYARLNAGDEAGARRAFDRALELSPSLPQPRYYLGLMALRSGDIAGAEAALAALRPLAPPLASALAEQIDMARSSGR